MKEKMKKEPNGYTIRSDRKLNTFLMSLKEQTGARSIRHMLWTMLKCPELPSFVFDFYRETSFELDEQTKKQYIKQNNVAPSGQCVFQLSKNRMLVKQDE